MKSIEPCASIGFGLSINRCLLLPAEVRRLDWNEIADPEDPSTVNFEWTPDMIIASDIVFDGTDFDPLCTTISKIFETYSNECCMILANAVRNEDTQQKFFEKIGKWHRFFSYFDS